MGKPLGWSWKKVAEGGIQKCFGSINPKNWKNPLDKQSKWLVSKRQFSDMVKLTNLIYIVLDGHFPWYSILKPSHRIADLNNTDRIIIIKCSIHYPIRLPYFHWITLIKLNKELYEEMRKMNRSGDSTDPTKVKKLGKFRFWSQCSVNFLLVDKNAAPIHFDKYGTNCLFFIEDEQTFQIFYERFPELFGWTRYNGETPYGHLIYRNKIFNFRSIDRKRFKVHRICSIYCLWIGMEKMCYNLNAVPIFWLNGRLIQKQKNNLINQNS